MTLCNQGCGTHLYFKIVNGKKRPFNVLDNEKHDCPMLHMAKLWGGYYDTIPMGPIRWRIAETLKVLTEMVNNLKFVIDKMDEQHTQNMEWKGQLEGYKKKLVDDQKKRGEQKRDTK